MLSRARKEEEDDVQKVTEGVHNVKVGVDDSNARLHTIVIPSKQMLKLSSSTSRTINEKYLKALSKSSACSIY